MRLGRLLVAACWVLLAGAARAETDELLIEFALGSNGALMVSYVPPAGVKEIRRMSNTPAMVRFWKTQVRPLDDCSVLQDDRIVLSARSECTAARLEASPTTLSMRATYEPAIPVSTTGMLSHTGFYAAAIPGHGLHWRWLAPVDGYVLHQGTVHRDKAEEVLSTEQVDAAVATIHSTSSQDALGSNQYVYLGRAPLLAFPGGTLVRDPDLPDATVDLVIETLTGAMRRLGSAYGRMPLGPVGVVGLASDMSGYQGGVASGRMMALRFERHPSTPLGSVEVKRFIDHEVAHWWNAGVFHSDDAFPWLHEGHADWVALLLLRERGDINDAEARDMLEAAINRCMLARGDKPAVTISGRWGAGDDPYACGMTLMFLGQAERQARAGSTAQAWTQLALLHTAFPLVDVTAFAAWADGGDTGPMSRLLKDADAGFSSTLLTQLATGGLADSIVLKEGPTLALSMRRSLAVSLMAAVMKADCAGSVSFTSTDESMRLVAGPVCAQLRLGDEVAGVEHVNLLTNPIAAWAAVTAACASRQTVAVQYGSGADSDVSCPTAGLKIPMTSVVRLHDDALRRLGTN